MGSFRSDSARALERASTGSSRRSSADGRGRSSDDAPAARNYLEVASRRVDRALDRIIPAAKERPEIIHDAMRYTALSGGKRLRPAMVLLAYETFGGTGRKADAVAATLEMVHAFSLIHDDLPAMDDDDYRRGRLSNHKVFGDGVAILAGDALLARSFHVLGELGKPGALGPAVAARLVEELGAATGSGGVIGGQALDLLSEGKKASRATLLYIHRHKTARLFTAALRMGGIAAEASAARLALLTAYGEGFGLAFQIVDDILGAAGTFRELGREPGRDAERGKATYPGVIGFAASHKAVDRHLKAARTAAARMPQRRDVYRGLVDILDARRRDAKGELLRPAGKA